MIRETMKMNPGDVIIVSGVTDMVVVTDIGYNVPHGKNTPIPANIALGSSELWNHISCGRIFWHNRPTDNHQQAVANQKSNFVVEPQPVVSSNSNTRLQSELSKVQDESVKAQFELLSRIGVLEAENARLRAESEKKSTDDDKLKTILERLDNLPTATVQVVTQAQLSTTTAAEPDTEEKVPIYIPSLPDARSIPSRITPKVIKTDGSDVEKAGKALRQFRKQGG
jgi:uncharacterized small protein (DUF1192 family)